VDSGDRVKERPYDVADQHDVPSTRRDRWVGCVADNELGVGVCVCSLLASLLDHRGGKIDPNDTVAGGRQQDGQRSGSTPEIQDVGCVGRHEFTEQPFPRREDTRIAETVIRFLVE
jgi:hypothetical protein